MPVLVGRDPGPIAPKGSRTDLRDDDPSSGRSPLDPVAGLRWVLRPVPCLHLVGRSESTGRPPKVKRDFRNAVRWDTVRAPVRLETPSPRPAARYGRAVQVSEERFEELVVDALDSIPDTLSAEMENVAVMVEEWPTAAQLEGRGGTLLGLYEGVPLTARDPITYAGVSPDRITIFRGPLCEQATSEDELAAQVRVTVLHEVGHHFGIDDDRLDELGWA